MRVLHFTDVLEPGGVSSVILDLAQMQSERGHSIHVASLKSGSWDRRALDADIPVERGLGALREIYAADIVHCHQRGVGLIASVLRKRGVVEHAHNFLSGHRALSYRGNMVVAVASQIEAHLSAEYPATRNKSCVIPNGCRDLRNLAAVSVSQNHVGSRFTLVGAGRMTRQKNPVGFLHVIRSIIDQGFKVHGKWVGDGELRDEFRRKTHKLELTGVVEHVPWLDRVSFLTELAHADAHVISSAWEGLPMSAIESLCLGTPVLSTPIGHLSDVLEQVGFRAIDTENGRSLGTITRLVSDEDFRKHSRVLARQAWEDHFMLERTSSKWEDVYERAISLN
jgi:glycosyltransferase involved in cell wall biosynthesis